MADSSKELSAAVKSQEDIASAAQEADIALEDDQDGHNFIIGLGLGFGLTIVALLGCVLARIFKCLKYVSNIILNFIHFIFCFSL